MSGRLILSDINLKIYRGDCVGIAGPVGSGKTTLLYILLGLISADSGTIKIFKKDIHKESQLILSNCNYASSLLKLNGYATITENLRTFAKLYEIQNAQEKIDALVSEFKLTNLVAANTKVYKLSAGENTRLNLCKALLNEPKLLLTDEISVYLDPPSKKHLFSLLKKRRQNKNDTTIYVSHDLKEIQRLCNKVVILNKGKVVYFGDTLTAAAMGKYYDG